MEQFQVFISYRRDGGEFLAGRVSDKLTNMGYSVFYDIESMRAGAFNEQIYTAIDQCEAVLLILPPHALDRCKDENDWVRLELEHSLKQKKTIIPLLMRGFEFPTDLPESIREISMREGVVVDSYYFDAVIDRVCTLMQIPKPLPKKPDDENLKNGIRYLTRKMYTQAIACFETEIGDTLSSPEPYFYVAIAKLGGKRPFLASRSVIGEIESYLESAIAYGERALYYYLYAYIKQDYYEKKLLKSTPDSGTLFGIAQNLGITDAEVTELFELLGVPKP